MFLMRLAPFAIVLSIVAAMSGCISQNTESQNIPPVGDSTVLTEAKQAVLVELFTSEGCSSCPSADKALAFLNAQQPVAGADIVTLAYHVDYWNSDRWTDRFSSPLYSRRQESYRQKFNLSSIYTPQMVVDGQAEFAGNNLRFANSEIEKSKKLPKGKIEASIYDGRLKLAITDLPKHRSATVYLVAAEDDLTTNVSGGENSGETLQHVSVVRELKSLGVTDDSSSEFKIEAALPVNTAWKRENMKFVIFVQENEGRQIIAVREIRG